MHILMHIHIYSCTYTCRGRYAFKIKCDMLFTPAKIQQ